MDASANGTGARMVNLVIPGGGLIMIGAEVTGVLIAIVFAATASISLAATLLIPDDVPPTWRGLCIGLALGTYVGAQIRFAQTAREQRTVAADRARRFALREARAALLAGRVENAWNMLQPLMDRVGDDLLLAYRVAQVLTARGDRAAALSAWRRVRRLDRHRVYRQEVAEQERELSGLAPAGDTPSHPSSRQP